MTITTEGDFHNAVHSTVGTAIKKYVSVGNPKFDRRIELPTIHAADWAVTRVNIAAKTINIDVFIDFQQNSLSATDYIKLRSMAMTGINRYWSRAVTLDGDLFATIVAANHRASHSLGVDMYVETSNKYARSHNTGIIDASFIYNKGYFRGTNAGADQDFMLVSAHEFGHAVLNYFGGVGLSWSHKDSTSIITQSVKSTTPGYPASGDVDLMKYYDSNKYSITNADKYSRTRADEQDVKRLIWLSDITF